jgi:hypothetical protein
MKKDRTLLLASSLLCIAAIGCSSQPESETTSIEPLPTVTATGDDDRPRLIAAVRGSADLALLPPDANNQTIDGSQFIVTDIEVMNLADAPIAGLTVEDLWYNNDGEVISGDTYRHPTPLPPGEAVTVTLEVPRVQGIVRNQYQFSHANGEISPVQMDEFPVEEAPEDAEPADAPAQ